jgi:hypothetical protein
MRKLAEDTLVEGLKHPDGKTAEICGNALIVLKRGKGTAKWGRRPRRKGNRIEIREIPGKGQQRRVGQRARRPNGPMSRRRNR